jgi:hypothetical protein
MKIAYLILAHNNAQHLQRLISALTTDSSSFFIHLDRKTERSPFLSIGGDNVHFTEQRAAVHWGDFSQVEAVLILLQAAQAGGFDRCVLLSGADYPLRSALAIERFFAAEPEREFMNLVAMPSQAAGKSLSRLSTYQLRATDPLLLRAGRKALMLAGVLPRQRDYQAHLGALAPYAGSTWWALSRAACDHILAFAARETSVVEFFKNTQCPDESFFHTILGNSPFRRHIARNLTYTDWSDGGASPANMAQQHLTLFKARSSFPADDTYGAGAMLFARKFTDQSAQLVARMDRQIKEQEGTQVSEQVRGQGQEA